MRLRGVAGFGGWYRSIKMGPQKRILTAGQSTLTFRSPILQSMKSTDTKSPPILVPQPNGGAILSGGVHGHKGSSGRPPNLLQGRDARVPGTTSADPRANHRHPEVEEAEWAMVEQERCVLPCSLTGARSSPDTLSATRLLQRAPSRSPSPPPTRQGPSPLSPRQSGFDADFILQSLAMLCPCPTTLVTT